MGKNPPKEEKKKSEKGGVNRLVLPIVASYFVTRSRNPGTRGEKGGREEKRGKEFRLNMASSRLAYSVNPEATRKGKNE